MDKSLSSEARKSLRKILAAHPSAKVDLFLAEIELDCTKNITQLTRAPGRADHRTRLLDAIKNIASTRKTLIPFLDEVNLIPQETFDDFYGESAAQAMDKNFAMVNEADAAVAALRVVTARIEAALVMLPAKKRGKRSGADKTGLATEIAKAYTKHLGRPSASADGVFGKIMHTVFAATGSEPGDIRRVLRAAVVTTHKD